MRVLRNFLDFLLHKPKPLTLNRFIAVVTDASHRGQSRQHAMRRLGLSSHAEFRRLAKTVKALGLALPTLHLERSRAVHYVGNKGITIPLSVCEEAGLARNEAVRFQSEGSLESPVIVVYFVHDAPKAVAEGALPQ